MVQNSPSWYKDAVFMELNTRAFKDSNADGWGDLPGLTSKLDYIQAQDDYVLLKTPEKGHLKQQTISSLEARLDPKRFLRIHRSYIIQLDRLVRLEQTPSESWLAILSDGSRLPVSRSGYARLKETLDRG